MSRMKRSGQILILRKVSWHVKIILQKKSLLLKHKSFPLLSTLFYSSLFLSSSFYSFLLLFVLLSTPFCSFLSSFLSLFCSAFFLCFFTKKKKCPQFLNIHTTVFIIQTKFLSDQSYNNDEKLWSIKRNKL